FLFSTVAIGVIDGDQLVFRNVASRDMPVAYSNPISCGICGRVVRSGVGELVVDVRSDPDYVLVTEDVEREVCVPIIVDGAVWGVLNIEATAEVPLSSEEFDVMRTLASSLGLAIERSRQQRAEAHRLDQLAHLQRIAGRIAGRVDLDGAGEDILDEIRRVFEYATLGLGIMRDGNVDAYFAYASLLDGAPPYRSAPISGIVGRVLRTGEPIFARDVRDEPDYRNVHPDTTQEICVPVRAGGSVIGVLNAEVTRVRRLDDSDLDILLTLADHLGTAISNHLRIAELEWRNQQLRLVDRVTSLIAGQITILDALPLVLAEIEGAFGYGTSGIGLIDGDRLVFAAMRDSNDDSIQEYFQVHGVSIDTGVTGRVARTGQPAFIQDVSSSPDYLPTRSTVEHEICVPIQSDGRTIGVLNVETPASKPLVHADLEILSTIANHLGMAFARSEAYEAERRSRTAIEAIQRVSAIVSSTLDPDEALQRIVETLAAAFDYPFVAINLIDGVRLDPAAWRGLSAACRMKPSRRRSASVTGSPAVSRRPAPASLS
ncbi:MAG: GAF domain-containing protein, partial [Thermomicrobiales bacterium]